MNFDHDAHYQRLYKWWSDVSIIIECMHCESSKKVTSNVLTTYN